MKTMPDIKRLGFLGGTFNPPHIGHIAAARAAHDALSLGHVLFIPASLPPHKELPQKSAPASDRLMMARLAAASLPYASASDIELSRGGKSYTADTLNELGALYPGAALWLICGGDMFLTLQGWRRAEDIFRLCRVAAPARKSGGEKENIIAHARFLESAYGAKIDIIDNPVVEISSTELRESLARGVGCEYLPPGVAEYIQNNKLYK